MDRRCFLSLLAWPVVTVRGQERATSGQGMASRGIAPAPRAKPSGLPFHASFTDVAQRAGLNEVVVSGHSNRADYAIEAMSCGAAFFDYDNDGWLDALVLSGSRRGRSRRLPQRIVSTGITGTEPFLMSRKRRDCSARDTLSASR